MAPAWNDLCLQKSPTNSKAEVHRSRWDAWTSRDRTDLLLLVCGVCLSKGGSIGEARPLVCALLFVPFEPVESGSGGAPVTPCRVRTLLLLPDAGAASARRRAKLGSHPSEPPVGAATFPPALRVGRGRATVACCRADAEWPSRCRMTSWAVCDTLRSSLATRERTVCESLLAKLALHMKARHSGTVAMALTALRASEMVAVSEWKSIRCSTIHMRWSCSSVNGTKRTRFARHLRIGIRLAALDSSASSMRATTSEGAPRLEQMRRMAVSPSITSSSTRPTSCAARNLRAKEPSPSRSRMPDCKNGQGRQRGWASIKASKSKGAGATWR
eukprot:scaffold239087_cov24-Tisochrysis_lutea.AAC.2